MTNGQADLLLGYVMDQAIKLQDATGKPVTPIRFADSGVNQISSGIITNKNLLTENPDLVKRFMRASTRGRRSRRERAPRPRSTRCSRPTPRPACATP